MKQKVCWINVAVYGALTSGLSLFFFFSAVCLFLFFLYRHMFTPRSWDTHSVILGATCYVQSVSSPPPSLLSVMLLRISAALLTVVFVPAVSENNFAVFSTLLSRTKITS
jgi:hypothetical protein